MKKIKWLAVLLTISSTSFGQDFLGYRSGNYTGVNGVFFNPANAVDSRYKWDFNLVSLGVNLGNNNATFKLKDISNFDSDTLKNQIFGKGSGPSSALVSANVVGPSVLVNLNKKMAIALTTRARVIVNVNNIDGQLANQLIGDGSSGDITYPYPIVSNENMAASVNGWTEFGLSLGRVILDKNKHFLKGGVSLKYLAGAANGYVNVNKLHATLNKAVDAQGDYITNASGGLGVGFGGIKIDDFSTSDLLSFESSGFGGDIGFVYEFRPNAESHKTSDGKWKGDHNKYKLRFGAALLDIGSIKYEQDATRSGAYNIDITGGERLYEKDLDGVKADEIKTFLNSKPTLFTPSPANALGEVTVKLPTTLQLDLDYHIKKGFYLNMASQISLSKMDNKPYSSQYYNSFTFTPRFEGKSIGLYIPVNYSDLTELNAGVTLRLGPLFIGSGSILTAMFDDSKQVDVHFGLRFGGFR